MNKFVQTNNVRDKLQCPKCDKIFFIFRHKTKKVDCPECSWDGSFHYPDEQGEVLSVTNNQIEKIVKDMYGKDVKIFKEKSYRKDGSISLAVCHVVSNAGKASIRHYFNEDESTDYVRVDFPDVKSINKSFHGENSYISAESYAMGEI